MDKLRECPFCGAEPMLAEDVYGSGVVQCFNCGASITDRDKAKAIAAWNRRFEPPEEE